MSNSDCTRLINAVTKQIEEACAHVRKKTGDNKIQNVQLNPFYMYTKTFHNTLAEKLIKADVGLER